MIRFADKKEGKEIVTLLWEIFEEMELPLLEKIHKDTLTNMIAEAFLDPNYRYSYKHGLVYEVDGEIAGVIYGYPAEVEQLIDQPFQDILLKNGYHPEEILFVDRETFPNEWYIDSLVVKDTHRGLGIGSLLIEEMSRLAKSEGYQTVGLNVDLANPKAKELYSKLQFKKVGDIVISGHQYDHMQKTL
ncbi:GNAT family N-acetyltransferase [Bacillus sp. AGMB 02131]|uniref:GNAT family N-acetyltransferase n=1 Tax=Peribacillus faecalis TaxID=2772559 RepID=A0A927CTG3_9BACI|nr:GNAT family N-acetyltransferase [Peribacillus faecalis]MBD3107553.1 GNAT family N-acetyltransferase [Peribacillus faecalis]